MAPKRPLPPPKPPISSSEEEDDEANSSEEEEEEEKPTKMADATRKVNSGSDSDDSEPESQPQLPRSAKSSTTTKVSKSASSKRPSESELKRAKKEKKVLEEAVIEEDPKKKQLFQRVWSDEDEIAILKGAIEFASKKGADPIADLNGFHEFVKKSLRLDFSRDQLRNKVKRLKKRFENNVGKGKRGKGHEQELYDLSKKIWGGGNGGGGGGGGGEGSSEMGAKVAKVNAEQSRKNHVFQGKTDNNVVEIVEGINWFGGLPRMGEKLIKEGLEIVGDGGVEWKEKWKKLQVAELEVFLKRAELIKELMEMALEGR